MRRLLQRISRWILGPPLPTFDPASLDRIYQRRFLGRNRARFAQIWCEVARISRSDPSQLHEDDALKDLGAGKVRFPELVLEELSDYASSHVRRVPKLKITTLGEYVDWLLDEDCAHEEPKQ